MRINKANLLTMLSSGKPHSLPGICTRFVVNAVVIFSALLLTACARSTPAPADPTSTPTVTPTISVLKPTPVSSPTPGISENGLNELNGVRVEFWHPWTGDTQAELIKLVDQFNQTNEWGIHVIMSAQGSAGLNEQNIWDGIAAQDYPQIVAVSTQMLLAIDERSSLVVDLEKYLRSDGIGLSEIKIGDFQTGFWEEDFKNGKRYGIPAQRTMTVLFYNLTWAKDLGFSSIPESPEELQEQVCAANRSMRTDADTANDGIGGLLTNTDAQSLLSWLYVFDAELIGEDSYSFRSDEVEMSFEFLLNLYKDACMWSGKNSQPYDYFSKRQALMFSGEMQDIPVQTAASIRNVSSDSWGIIPFPGVDGSVALTSGYSYGVLRSGVDKDLASWLFIRWLSEPEQQAKLVTASVTLPLGRKVIDLVPDLGLKFPQWITATRYLNGMTIPPPDADWTVVKRVLEDGGWQLLQSGTTLEAVSSILAQMEELAAELSGRYP